MKSLKAILVIITMLTGSLGILVSDVNSESSSSDRQAASNSIEMHVAEETATDNTAVTPTQTVTVAATATPTATPVPTEPPFILSTEHAMVADEHEPADASVAIVVDGEEIVIPEAIHLDKSSAENAVMGGAEPAGEEVDIEEMIRRFAEDEEEQEEDYDYHPSSGSSDSGSVEPGGYWKTVERFGVDVSEWNDDIDWYAMARAGVQFAFIRAGGRTWGGGSIYYDDYFVENVRGAAAAGIDVGVYFYSTAITISEAKEEAAWVINEINKNGLASYINYPIAFDMEEVYGHSDRRHNGLTSEQYTKMARAFLDVVKQNGYTPCLYASASYFYDVWDMDYFDDCVIWLAQYNDVVDYDVDYDIWQYTASGKVSGNGTTYCDLNIEYRKEYVGPSQTATATPTATTAPTVTPKEDDSFDVVPVSDDYSVAIDELNVRSTPSTKDYTNVIGVIQNGEVIHRTGIVGSWSEFEYKGQKGYVLTKYLQLVEDDDDDEEDEEDYESEKEGDDEDEE